MRSFDPGWRRYINDAYMWALYKAGEQGVQKLNVRRLPKTKYRDTALFVSRDGELIYSEYGERSGITMYYFVNNVDEVRTKRPERYAENIKRGVMKYLEAEKPNIYRQVNSL
jgi:hypothetical protein